MKVSLLFTGKKLNEPVMWHGPIVMNTQQQIKETHKDIRSGSFLQYGFHGITSVLTRRSLKIKSTRSVIAYQTS
jgi:hypothetical protein